MLERVSIPVEHNLIEFVCGDNDQNLAFFYKKSGVVHLNVDKDKHTGNFSIIAIGTHRAVDDLATIVQTHINLHNEY